MTSEKKKICATSPKVQEKFLKGESHQSTICHLQQQKTGTGKPSNNDWGKVSNFRTKSPWNKVSANEKGNPSKLKWNSLLDDEDTFKGVIQQKQNLSFAT